MDNKTTKGLRFFSVGFTVFIIFVFLFICLRVVARQIFIKHMGITNFFTDLVLFDADSLNKSTNSSNKDPYKPIKIDWQELYPFLGAENDPVGEKPAEKKRISIFDRIKNSFFSIEDDITQYATVFLPFYRTITELAGTYEQLILWNFSSFKEYNNITILDDGYLVAIDNKVDITEVAEATIELADYCKSEEVEFAYIEYPNKICIYEDSDISGTLDFSNQNADDFLNLLKDKGIFTYDLRKVLHEEGLNHHSLFFKTDHHWKPQTGLWAAQHILTFLNNSFGYSFNTEMLDNNMYYEQVYENWFLGSQGKKVTLSVSAPEDISLIYPKFETLIHYEIPNLSIDKIGGFDVTYDMRHIEEKSYYKKNPYGAYDYADQPLIKIENELIDDETHVLIVHNSFSNCVIPFLAMGIKKVDAIDLRHFTGSLKSYISQEKPDVVIVAYQGVIEKIDYSDHVNSFDFR